MRFASSNALSRMRVTCVETCGCCCAPSMARLLCEACVGLGAERARVRHELPRQLLVEQREQQVLGIELWVARPARQLLCCGDCLLGLDGQLVEVHAFSLPSYRMPLLAVEHEVAAVFLVNSLDLVAQLLLQVLDLNVCAAQLVFELQHELDAREIEAELRRQPLDDAQPLDVGLRVEARPARRALRPHETLRLVRSERLRVHA